MSNPQNNSDNQVENLPDGETAEELKTDEIEAEETTQITDTTEQNTQTESPTEQSDNTKAKKQKSKKRLILKIFIIIICCILGLMLVLAAIVFGMWYAGKQSFLQSNVKLVPTAGIEAIVNDDNTVVYNGKIYKYNENMATCLFIGVDNDKKYSEGKLITGNAGQGDAIYLIAVDTDTGKTTVIGVPRDTVTDVEIYSKSGSYAGIQPTQICLAFAYGDGKATSCENTVRAVSRLFYGMPISAYFSINEKSMATLHNAVGPITVVPNETIENHAINFTKGKSLKLTGSNVFKYLRVRDESKVDSSYLRMQRQLDYIKKYSMAAYEKTEDDLLFPVELYKKIMNNAVTDINLSQITYMASVIIGNKDTAEFQYISLEGEMKSGEDNYAEFYPDETKLFETVLSVYYNEVK